ncbi:MAG: RNA polymerase sigma factor, partial [Planctomycetota bacterium]
LHRLLGRLTRCEHTTRDLMQELFIKLSSSSGFDKALNPYAYAWKTATNLAFSRHRRKKLACEAIEIDKAQLSDDSAPKPLEQIIRQEELQQVLDMTGTFKELARNVIVMRFIEQKNYEQIAERLGKNPGYLRALCSKTLTQLRHKLNCQLSDDIQTEVSHG